MFKTLWDALRSVEDAFECSEDASQTFGEMSIFQIFSTSSHAPKSRGPRPVGYNVAPGPFKMLFSFDLDLDFDD